MGISAYEASVYRNVREQLKYCDSCVKVASCAFCIHAITHDEQRVYKRTKHKLYLEEYKYRVKEDGTWTHNGQEVSKAELEEYIRVGHKAYFEAHFAEDLLNDNSEMRYA